MPARRAVSPRAIEPSGPAASAVIEDPAVAPRPAPGSHEYYMAMALREAAAAASEDEVPIGAVIVLDERVIARAHNQRERLHDPTAHAEMIAITQAAGAIESSRLEGATLYATLEPCAMCAGAMVLARVARLVYGAADPKAGACGTLYDIVRDPRLNHRLDVVRGVLEAESAELLRAFFRAKR